MTHKPTLRDVIEGAPDNELLKLEKQITNILGADNTMLATWLPQLVHLVQQQIRHTQPTEQGPIACGSRGFIGNTVQEMLVHTAEHTKQPPVQGDEELDQILDDFGHEVVNKPFGKRVELKRQAKADLLQWRDQDRKAFAWQILDRAPEKLKINTSDNQANLVNGGFNNAIDAFTAVVREVGGVDGDN